MINQERFLQENSYLYRYIDLSELYDCLSGRIIFRDPKFWEDRNDYFLIDQYVQERNIPKIFAMCFTKEGDAYHFWKIYANRPSGVCIKFQTVGIIDAINADSEFTQFRYAPVQYRPLKDLAQNDVTIDEYPFIKRVAFKAENEIRFFYEDAIEQRPYRALAINIQCITEIILSPWMRDEYVAGVMKTLEAFNLRKKIKLRKSTILNSTTWQNQLTY